MSETQKGQSKGETKKNRKLRTALIVMIGCLAAFAVYAYVNYAQQFKTVFYEGTVINGIDAGFRTPADVEKEIRDKAENYTIDLTFREDAKETIDGDAIDYHYVSDGSVQELFDKQHFLLWPRGHFSGSETNVAVDTAYDADKLQAILAEMPELQPDNMTEPKNAKVRFKKKKFKVVSEKYGTTLDPELVSEKVASAIDGAETALDIDSIEGAYENPTVFKDDKALAQECKELNKLACASITWDLPGDEDKTLNGNTLKKWLKKDDGGHYYKDEAFWEQNLEEYLTELAAGVDNLDGIHKFEATGLGEAEVYSDTYGWKMDFDTELAQTRQELENGEIKTREPNWLSQALYTENWGFGPNYIEVDLSRQHMWVYKDSQLAMECDYVSGTMTYARYTPSGIYFMKWKEMDHILTGPRDEDGNPEYEAHADYWIPFNGDIGFHDASWRGSFGGEIYVYSGSHGCINMDVPDAGRLYELIDNTMPIVVYYSKGCPFENYTNADKALRESWENGTGDNADEGSSDEYYDSNDTGSDDESYDDSDSSYDDESYEDSYEDSYEESGEGYEEEDEEDY